MKTSLTAFEKEVLDTLSLHAKVYFVGGIVRDYLRKINDFHDIDVEVFGIDIEKLQEILSQFGDVDQVGKSFGVLKLSSLPRFDFALPRKEYKVGTKHQDFQIEVNEHLSLKEACMRRDLTINAMMYDYKNEEIIDLFNGQEDLENKVIRMIDKQKFQEDPLRVLRIAQFASRFEFDVDSETKQVCKEMVEKGMLEDLSYERVVDEYNKLLLSKRPSIGLTFLQDIKGLFPPIQCLEDCDQRRDFHPEGSVMNHTLLVVDLAALCKEETSWPLAFMWGALLHDIGKPAVTTPTGSAPKHNESGVEEFKRFFGPVIKNKKMKKYIETMIYYHMHLMNMMRNQSKDYSYYKLLYHIENIMPIEDLAYISRCDKLGRYAHVPQTLNQFDAFIEEKINRLGKETLKPCINGEMLIELGFEDKTKYSELLDWAYDLQMRGHSQDSIIELLKGKRDGR